jgi:hypothetical protein
MTRRAHGVALYSIPNASTLCHWVFQLFGYSDFAH